MYSLRSSLYFVLIVFVIELAKRRCLAFVERGLLSRHRVSPRIQIQIQNADIDVEIPILFESDHILAIDKPCKIPHHNDGEMLGILNLLRQKQDQGELSYKGRLYGVHRLDRVTSGILLLAKDAETAKDLTQAFREGHVVKYYAGISRSKPIRKKQGLVQGNMVRGRRKSWYLTREKASESTNYAKTRFFTAGLSRLNDYLISKEMEPKTLILFRPSTGRTHQLRVAAKSVGLPLAGDTVYRDSYPLDTTRRTYLHSMGLHLPANNDREEITIWSPPPFDLWSETGQTEFDVILESLVLKHCDCPAILDLLTSYYPR